MVKRITVLHQSCVCAWMLTQDYHIGFCHGVAPTYPYVARIFCYTYQSKIYILLIVIITIVKSQVSIVQWNFIPI